MSFAELTFQDRLRNEAFNAFPGNPSLDELRGVIGDEHNCYFQILEKLKELSSESHKKFTIPFFATFFPNGRKFGEEVVRVLNHEWVRPSPLITIEQLDAVEAQVQLGLEMMEMSSLPVSLRSEPLQRSIYGEWEKCLSDYVQWNSDDFYTGDEKELLDAAGSIGLALVPDLPNEYCLETDERIFVGYFSGIVAEGIDQEPNPFTPWVALYDLGFQPLGIQDGRFHIRALPVQKPQETNA